MFEKMILKNGVVNLNDCYFSSQDSLENLYDLLKEDLLQIELKKTFIIDVGWYPEFCEDGSFHIMLIKNYDWDHPKYLKETRSLKELEKEIYFLIEEVDFYINAMEMKK